MNLVPKLSLAIIGGVSVVFALNGYFRVRREVALFESDRARDEALLGEALAPAFESTWKNEGMDRALAVLSRANARQGRVRVRWVWLDGSDAIAGRPVADALASGETATRLASEGADERRYTFFRVAIPDARRGALEVSESLAPERAYIRQTITSTIETGLALDAFCAVLATAVGAWLVGRPMSLLADKARRVGQGDFGGPLHLAQRDEIAALAGEMNAMCDRLVEANARAAREMQSRLEMLEQLRHADRLVTVGKLASGVAHEIGTPLNVVEARALMIAEGSTTPEESVEYARVIARATDRIARIIRQLLAFARRGTAQKARCDVAVHARHAIELLEPLAAKRNVRLALAGGDAPSWVDADAGQIEQVLTNLVMNAIHASHGGTVELALDEASATPPADVGGPPARYVRVRVRDEGHGIAPDHLAHVFEPFFTTKDVGEGTGLGLSISYGIVREHGGWITAESEPGRGALFTFYLPKPEPS
jgi:signal transduction histidine kinase